MRVDESILYWEKTLEKQVMNFFMLLGARETPECWQAELQETPAEPGKKHPARPEAHPNKNHH